MAPAAPDDNNDVARFYAGIDVLQEGADVASMCGSIVLRASKSLGFGGHLLDDGGANGLRTCLVEWSVLCVPFV